MGNNITKSKVLMTLSIMSALSKKYESINASCVLALNKEKSRASKIEVKSATKKTLMFFHGLKNIGIQGNEETVLQFCSKATDILIENSAGRSRVRGFTEIKNAITEQLKEVDVSGIDDSHKLIKELG